MATGEIYCMGCKDYVYDKECERIYGLEKLEIETLISSHQG
jgi:hypothetical protein